MDTQQHLSGAVDLEIEQPNDDIPEEDEDLTLSDSANTTTFAPPERISARFYSYRPSVTRRKSSAASSRRNSLTSNHSQMSNSSYRQACRNNHVAQYLRRASILEGRKQRLQAREAHAEQVRIRAALAKCTPRSSNSEERALAAQRAREEHLAKVAGACAEEVRRAKEKSEQIKKQRAAEEERYRQEMEEKQAEVQRRRLEYKKNALRRPRGASTPPNAESKKPVLADQAQLEPETAAERIQIAWRTRHRKKILAAFNALGLSIDSVHAATFDEVSEKLLDKNVIATSTRVMDMYNLLANDPPGERDAGVPCRTFLTAFMILGHPTGIFDNDGELERDVMAKAKDLILCFEQVLSKSTAFNRYTPTPTLLEDLLLAHSAYVKSLADWKSQDASTLVEMMVGSFANLDAIWQSVKDDADGEVATDYKDGIRKNQIMLFARLQKLAGKETAGKLVRKAINASRRKNTPRRKPVGDVRPRVAVEQVIHPEAVSSSENPEVPPVVTSPLAPSPVADANVQSQLISQMFSVMPDNRTLSHELALDKDYRMGNERATAFRTQLNETLCADMLRGFKEGQGNAWTVAMVEHVRSKLLHVVKTGPTHTLISEVLDPVLTSRQCAEGLFSYEKFFDFTAKLLPKLCAPFRDEEVQALVQDLRRDGSLEEMITKLGRLLRTIDDLTLDHSNFMLMKSKPLLLQHAAEYERHCFAKDLEEGKTTLQKTKRWWHNANVNCYTESDQRDPRGNLTVQKIYARGLVDLAIASTPLRENEVPETLGVDIERLRQIRGDAVRITTIAAILLSAKSLLKRDTRQQWAPEARRMWEILRLGYGNDDDSIPTKVYSVIESSRSMSPTAKAQLLGMISRLLSQADSGKLTDTTAKLLFQRLKTHIFKRISASSDGERIKIASSTGQELATMGFPDFMENISGIVDLLSKISDADRKAHGTWYEEIATECKEMGEREERAASAVESSTSPRLDA
ncbi:hypothetical protein FKW77_008018 [Venturia effusa]|uniref:Uncharacterized protein n=1 Tax=Venturia effusa TaxID=50376 RepID=A0A517LLW0_9PEZI|nr:hypothetical protein FKW77_008018 [Venturia effusa]